VAKAPTVTCRVRLRRNRGKNTVRRSSRSIALPRKRKSASPGKNSAVNEKNIDGAFSQTYICLVKGGDSAMAKKAKKSSKKTTKKTTKKKK
jgi:hypothetical protein